VDSAGAVDILFDNTFTYTYSHGNWIIDEVIW